MKGKGILVFLGALLLVFTVQFFSAYFTQSSIATWYQTLNQPSWSPPDWIFAPVWTLLYLMIAFAVFFVWKKGGSFAAYFFWGLQLFFNFLWSFLFFKLQSPLLGLIDIVLLWVSLGITTILFFRHSVLAGLLFVPYWIWLSYAVALNFMLWKLN